MKRSYERRREGSYRVLQAKPGGIEDEGAGRREAELGMKERIKKIEVWGA